MLSSRSFIGLGHILRSRIHFDLNLVHGIRFTGLPWWLRQ